MTEPELKEIGPIAAITDSFTGPYNQTGAVIDEVIAWLLQTGHPYSGPPFAIYYDDPEKVDEKDLRAEVCLPVEENLEHTGKFERKHIEGGSFVAFPHQGPYDGIPEVYEKIFDWIEENGYEFLKEDGTREVFHKVMGEVESSDELLTEILVPVKDAG